MDHPSSHAEDVSEHEAVCAFQDGLRYKELYLKFSRTGDMSMNKMMEIASRYANGEEEYRIRNGKGKAVDNNVGGNSNWKQKVKADSSTLAKAAALAPQGKFKGKPKGTFPPKMSKEDESSGKDPEKENDEEKDDFPEVQATLEAELIQFLREYWDIFAWKPAEMPGVPRELAKHPLRVDLKSKPVKEHLRRSAAEKRKAIGEEVHDTWRCVQDKDAAYTRAIETIGFRHFGRSPTSRISLVPEYTVFEDFREYNQTRPC
ncbi:hypothetical protein ZWY2020_050714 [Hordeum vulgare]|nr:hypothetical protein ZWY2020_050714 [Hordeum vulgare]